MAQQRARARARAVKLVLVALLIAYFSIIHTGVPRVCCRPMQLLLLGAAGCCWLLLPALGAVRDWPPSHEHAGDRDMLLRKQGGATDVALASAGPGPDTSTGAAADAAACTQQPPLCRIHILDVAGEAPAIGIPSCDLGNPEVRGTLAPTGGVCFNESLAALLES